MAFSGRALLQLAAELTNPLDLSTPTSNLTKSLQFTLSEGTGANQANRVWHDQRTLAASGTENLDLAGSLTDPFGVTITLAKLKAILVQAAAGNTNNVHVAQHATTGVPLFLAAGDGIRVKPGGLFFWIAPDAGGIAVTDTSADMFTVSNSGAGSSVTYDIVVIGATA